MDKLSAIDTPQSLKFANFLIGVGAVTTLGITAYIPTYYFGHYRHLAGRATQIGMSGLALGIVGGAIRALRKFTPEETAIFSLLPDKDCRYMKPREIALALKQGPEDESTKIQALKNLIRSREILIIRYDEQKKSISWDPRRLLGHQNWTTITDTPVYPELLQKALLAIFDEEKSSNHGMVIDLPTRVECEYTLSQVLPFIEKFKEIPNLIAIDFSRKLYNTETAKAVETVFLKLLQACPKLVEIPIALPSQELLDQLEENKKHHKQ